MLALKCGLDAAQALLAEAMGVDENEEGAAASEVAIPMLLRNAVIAAEKMA